MNKLINLISNSNFEKLAYNDNNRLTFANWSNVEEHNIYYLDANSGNYALKLNKKINNIHNYIETNDIAVKPNHKYYIACRCKTLETAIASDYIWLRIQMRKKNNYTSTDVKITSTKLNSWGVGSYIYDHDKEEVDKLSFGFSYSTDANLTLILDSVVLIDLTEVYGSGYEPSQTWCNNIPYFENEYDMEKIIKFESNKSIIYDELIQSYCCNNISPSLQFTIKDTKTYYPELSTAEIAANTHLTYYTVNNEGVEECPNTDLKPSDNVTWIENNGSYTVTIDNFKFKNKRHLAKLILTSTLTKTNYEFNVKDELNIIVSNNSDNIEYELEYVSTYIRKLKGTIANHGLTTNVDISINDVTHLPDVVIQQDAKTIYFEKDVFLHPGINTVNVITSDIFNNVCTKSEEIIIDVLLPQVEKKDLLENFIGDDDSKISLHLGNADLQYETKTAGTDKNILIDTSIDSHYFKLSGENANLYRISKDNLPLIQGEIIKRPLNVIFDYVEKIYDGTNDITSSVKRLKLDNGYYFVDANYTYNDYSNSGFIRGTHERKAISETIFKKNDYVSNEYVINNKNIDDFTIFVDFDGISGYPLFNEYTENTEIIFEDKILIDGKTINDIFKQVTLVKNTDETSSLKFIYKENIPKYQVKNQINIKYNYISNVDDTLNNLTYKTSDMGLVQVNFSKATLPSKNVTDEIQPVRLNHIEFVGDVLGDASENYQVASYNASGKIVKRDVTPHIVCIEKVYDGLLTVPFEMDDLYYHGLYNSIDGDDIYIDTNYENRKSVVLYNDANVGKDKGITVKSWVLEGTDANNYKVLNNAPIDITNASIIPRQIDIVINKIRLIRTTRKWEIDYYFINDIKSDNLTIIFNDDESNDNIKVYGGIDKFGNSIHLDYSNKDNVLDMFFNYEFNNEYQFTNITSELTHINNHTSYWTNEARPAEPNTERIDINITSDESYPGEIKLSLDTLSNGVQTTYFESKDKEYKLYSGCKVMITNIKLNSNNSKSENYILRNSEYETEIEIV